MNILTPTIVYALLFAALAVAVAAVIIYGRRALTWIAGKDGE